MYVCLSLQKLQYPIMSINIRGKNCINLLPNSKYGYESFALIKNNLRLKLSIYFYLHIYMHAKNVPEFLSNLSLNFSNAYFIYFYPFSYLNSNYSESGKLFIVVSFNIPKQPLTCITAVTLIPWIPQIVWTNPINSVPLSFEIPQREKSHRWQKEILWEKL